MAAILTKAVGRFVRVSPSKARLVASLVRGKNVEEALAILQYSPQVAARLIEKVLRSAIANAEHNHQVRSFQTLQVGVIVDGGPSMKRIQPRAMGRAFHILHRTSHITVTLSEAGDSARRQQAPGARRAAGTAGRATAGASGTKGRDRTAPAPTRSH